MISIPIPIYWLIAFVALVGIEIGTMALTTVWFAGGAIVAFLFSLFDTSIEVQLAAFVIVSFLLLFLTRPLAALPEILFDFWAQFVSVYDLPCCPVSICCHKYEISVCLFIMHHTGIDWDVLFRIAAFP